MTVISHLAPIFLLVASLGPVAVLAQGMGSPVACGQGTFKPQSSSSCYLCPPGTYNNQQNPNPASSCTEAQAGYSACGTQQVGNTPCYGAISQDDCGLGKYQSQRGQASCISCPPGSMCSTSNRDSPQLCSPGTAQPAAGASNCPDCTPGTFTSIQGATRCCNCCAGTFNNLYHMDHCYDCGEHSSYQRIYSPVGATSENQCQATPVPGVQKAPYNTCNIPPRGADMKAYCPAEQGNTPNPNSSAITKKRRSLSCAKGYTKCRVYHGRGGFECVDTSSNPEQCGGCVDVDFDANGVEDQGMDCTAIPDVNVVHCKRSRCVIQSCRRGFVRRSDGKRCVAGGIHVQSAKRR